MENFLKKLFQNQPTEVCGYRNIKLKKNIFFFKKTLKKNIHYLIKQKQLVMYFLLFQAARLFK